MRLIGALLGLVLVALGVHTILGQLVPNPPPRAVAIIIAGVLLVLAGIGMVVETFPEKTP